eukprot:bmy_21015T0
MAQSSRDCLCPVLAAYARRCAQEGALLSWRDQTLCPVLCPGGQEYQECAPVCGRNCGETEGCGELGSCVAGCNCPLGNCPLMPLPAWGPSLCPWQCYHEGLQPLHLPGEEPMELQCSTLRPHRGHSAPVGSSTSLVPASSPVTAPVPTAPAPQAVWGAVSVPQELCCWMRAAYLPSSVPAVTVGSGTRPTLQSRRTTTFGCARVGSGAARASGVMDGARHQVPPTM